MLLLRLCPELLHIERHFPHEPPHRSGSGRVERGMSAQEVPIAGPEQGGVSAGSPLPGGVKIEPGSSNGQSRDSSSPAEICVVIGESLNAQTLGSYVCGICGKKYKYYNCFQTHVRGHRAESDGGSGEGGSQGVSNSFRYTCDICGKKYKYYSCFQEHRDLHAVDDPYDQVVIPVDDLKDEEQVEPFLKIGPRTGSYICEFCGKQYKYFNPYQEHVALHAPIKSAFSRKMESKVQSSLGETNSSQNSSGTISPLVSSSFAVLQKPYACGTCGILFQFYSNLQEHTQSHVADSENHSKRNNAANLLPEKDRQQVAERLLRVMCSDLGALGVLGGKEFLRLAQTLVDSGARHGAYPLRDALGDVSALALHQLPRAYNQVKVKVTCALGSRGCPGIALTCHAQTGGAEPCYVLTAHQVEGVRVRRYVLGARELDLRDGGEQLQLWVQNVLSEFVMPELRAVYVTEPQRAAFCGRGAGPGPGACLSCVGCSLGAVVRSVLGRRSLQSRGLHDLAELLASCRDVAGGASLAWDVPSGTDDPPSPSLGPPPPPPCWDRGAEALLRVHERFEQVCEAYGRSRATAPLLRGLDRPLLATISALLAPIRQAALELADRQRPTLQLVLPAYLRLEKLFAGCSGELPGTGGGAKLCHCFLEALKENFTVERLHQVAMVLDPQLKLRPVPTHQHDDFIAKRGRLEIGGRAEEQDVKKEVFRYLSEPLFQATPNLFQYWSSVREKYPRLARLALWLLAVPAVGAVRGELAAVCEQAVAMRGQQHVSADDMNKLIFLRSNMA
ncbi:hypothetical protein AAFF_G00253680 [Aldrovandia affinis]|uniref:C2H2-type domain-containing protein n=1 Tax=Aldrovandia affinis TaxID=143900 RepID=A0AAD7WTQ6_9TELE|nr:hypothetical protein AAFF_G00253680 [Aldrovandia affinis]